MPRAVQGRKRNGSSHSDFLMNLEEQFRLEEYEEMTGSAFFTHLFLEQTDRTMARIATVPKTSFLPNLKGILTHFAAK